MSQFRETIKEEVIKQHGSIDAWSSKYGVTSDRFYNFLKGEYYPNLRTLEKWLETVGLTLFVKKD